MLGRFVLFIVCRCCSVLVAWVFWGVLKKGKGTNWFVKKSIFQVQYVKYKQRMKEEMKTLEKLQREELISKEKEFINAAYVIKGQKDELGNVKKKLHQCWGVLYCLLFVGVVLFWLHGFFGAF
ncbi:unnamed protein product [Trifolium pratense]|uniref:Uncharacterized protein n=1 Tax=Trifolium pratense TaxID=57577 RepID=A0ACB0JGD8_TRIPR|nr:unnamed protein product [Trifolium pratense]